MNKVIGAYLAMGLSMMEDMKTQSEQRKEEILVKWRETKKMPRKMKKRVRKELQLDWAIANWDPFDGMFNF
jgi:hypothetical protein